MILCLFTNHETHLTSFSLQNALYFFSLKIELLLATYIIITSNFNLSKPVHLMLIACHIVNAIPKNSVGPDKTTPNLGYS